MSRVIKPDSVYRNPYKLCYRILKAISLETLERRVNEEIKLGYVPLGGITTVRNGEWGTTWYHQPMLHYTRVDKRHGYV